MPDFSVTKAMKLVQSSLRTGGSKALHESTIQKNKHEATQLLVDTYHFLKELQDPESTGEGDIKAKGKAICEWLKEYSSFEKKIRRAADSREDAPSCSAIFSLLRDMGETFYSCGSYTTPVIRGHPQQYDTSNLNVNSSYEDLLKYCSLQLNFLKGVHQQQYNACLDESRAKQFKYDSDEDMLNMSVATW